MVPLVGDINKQLSLKGGVDDEGTRECRDDKTERLFEWVSSALGRGSHCQQARTGHRLEIRAAYWSEFEFLCKIGPEDRCESLIWKSPHSHPYLLICAHVHWALSNPLVATTFSFCYNPTHTFSHHCCCPGHLSYTHMSVFLRLHLFLPGILRACNISWSCFHAIHLWMFETGSFVDVYFSNAVFRKVSLFSESPNSESYQLSRSTWWSTIV